MDIWTVVAAAGAGYVAQHWKKNKAARQDVANSPSEDGVLALSESSLVREQVLEKNIRFRGVLTGKDEEKGVCQDIDLSSQDTLAEEAFLSTYGMENLALGVERCNDDVPRTNGDYPLQPSKEVCFSCPATNTSALRSRRLKGKALKPLTSLESCLMAQLYNEHASDDYIMDSVHSPRTPNNSSVVASGRSRMNSSTGGDFLKMSVEKQPEKNIRNSIEEPIYGISHLPRIADVNLRKIVLRRSERLSNSSITAANGKHQNIEGQPNGVLLFCLGISTGILSSLLENQREVDRLNRLLRQTNNLVEDLQDELEMKDSLTVKELAVEDDESPDTHHDSLDYVPSPDTHHDSLDYVPSHSPEAKLDDSMLLDHGKCHDEETKVLSLSKIEAELEAELERLELSINACSLEGKLSNLVELEPDFLPDMAVGEFKADLFSRQTGGQAYADQDGSGNSTPHSANYAVCPTELSLRLHEVIESRLEARVKELQAALQNSQRKFQFGEYDRIESWRRFSSTDAESTSHSPSPVRAVNLNLPDEAQETNKANDLFSKLNNSKDDKPHGIISSSSGTSSRPWEHSPGQVENGWMDNFEDICRDEDAYNNISYDLSSSRESDGGSQDEMEKYLIQHIVERARKQGSSVILNAQKALFSGNENGQ